MTRAGERVHDYLGAESDHFFDVPCLMLGILTVLAVVTPVLVWQWRAHRGPAMVIAVTIGMVIAAGAASGIGAMLVRLRYGALNVDAVPLSGSPSVAYVVEAPPVFFGHGPLQVAATLMWPAAHRGAGLCGARGRKRARRPGRLSAWRSTAARVGDQPGSPETAVS